VLKVSREAQAIYRISHRAHPALQAILVDLAQYRPQLEVGGSTVPESMRWGTDVQWVAQAEEILKEENKLVGVR
jgi:hypothetical protein